MNRRRLLLIASLPLAVAVVLGVLAMLPARPGVTKAKVDRIEKGMTMPAVEELLGRPGKFVPGPASAGPMAWFVWDENDGSFAAIGFLQDRVIEKVWEGSEEAFLDKIRRWFRLR
jgi:hypothetical protein